MAKYQNEGLNIIAERYPDIDFSDVDGKNVARVGEISKKLGIKIVFVILELGNHGFYEPKTNTIFVNDNESGTRNLFTIAHELGHYILHEGTHNRYDEYHKYTPEARKKEFEANDFAVKLLMPEHKFIKIFEKYKGNVRKIADIFGVSVCACEVRAFNLGLIDNM